MNALRRCRPALGTYVDIALDDAGDADARDALESAYGAIARVESLMSFHRADSDLGRINAARPGTTLRVDPWTAEVLALALALHAVSDGAFDCGVAARLVARGLLPASATGPCGAVGRSTLADIEQRSGARVHLRARVCLDLGGIAKGFAVDRAIEALRIRGVRDAMVNAGGDLRVLGPRPRLIHVRHPARPSELVPLGELADGAIATSGAYFSRATRADGTFDSALVDPLDGRSVTSACSFSVIAPRCAVADGLTKVLALRGRLAAPCLAHFGARGHVS